MKNKYTNLIPKYEPTYDVANDDYSNPKIQIPIQYSPLPEKSSHQNWWQGLFIGISLSTLLSFSILLLIGIFFLNYYYNQKFVQETNQVIKLNSEINELKEVQKNLNFEMNDSQSLLLKKIMESKQNTQNLIQNDLENQKKELLKIKEEIEVLKNNDSKMVEHNLIPQAPEKIKIQPQVQIFKKDIL